MTAIANNEDHKRYCENNYKKKMEGSDSDDNGLKTVDCLRGRLLAERHASRLAKEEAQILGDKLMELENRLKEETKLRQKADKKLQFLMKKLQSLNLSSSDLTDFSSSSISSSTCSSSSSAHKEYAHLPSPSEQHHSSSNADSLSIGSTSEGPAMETESQESYKMDDSLALVPLIDSTSGELNTENKNVSQVLEALKIARQKLEIWRE